MVRAGELKVDMDRHRVFTNDEEVHLTPTEYKLLVELIQNAGKVLVPDHLLDAVWGYQNETRPQLLWQAIHRLRQKIEPDPGNPTYIHTRQGIGYLFSSEKLEQKDE
jgi:two-component system KDP operon response regulator KdpE